MKKNDSKDNLKDFSSLGLSAFDFWNNEKDDIYDEFYKDIFVEK